MSPIHVEKVRCDMCGSDYSYFIWAFGSDKCLCKTCVYKRPQACLDDIDAIDLDKEQDIIHREIEVQQQRDFPGDRRPRSQPRKKGKGVNLEKHPYPNHIQKKIKENREINVVDVGEE